jgi:uncharacterized damage-inducible protein DinB
MSQPESVDERGMLLAYLNAQRNHVTGILEGLSEDDLRRPVLPSGWSCVGLVRHLALDVERFWFRAVIAGDRSVIDGLNREEDAWQVPPEVPAAQVFDTYRQERERADAIITSTPLDTPPAWWPDFFGDEHLENLRDAILHVMVETACHAGHLDAVRELIDGKQRLVLT